MVLPWKPKKMNENDIVEVQSTGKPLWCLNRIRPMLILFIDFVDGRVSGYLSWLDYSFGHMQCCATFVGTIFLMTYVGLNVA